MVVDVTIAGPLIKNDNVRHLPHILSWLLSRLEKISAKIFSELPTNWLIRRFYAKHSFINLLNYDFRHDKNINYPLSTINFQNVTAFYAVGASGKGCCKPLQLQRYNKKMTYANFMSFFFDFYVVFVDYY